MRTRCWFLFGGLVLALVGAGGLARAGKPGGGGPAPGGVIYFFSGLGSSAEGGSIAPDGTGEQFLTGAGTRRPSYALHGGKRWFLDKELDITLTNPRTNIPATRIVAIREDGAKVVLVPSGADWRASGAVPFAWAKDDSFFSYNAIVWYGSGVNDARSYIYRVDLAWDSGTGEPSVVGGPDVVLERAELDEQGEPISAIHGCDWEPGADRLVYEFHDASMSGSELRVYTIGSASDTLLAQGITAEWAPDGSRIVYDSPSLSSIRLVDPDVSGSDTALLTEPTKKDYRGPHWSPDGAHICLSLVSQGKSVGGYYATWSSVARVPAAGGSLTIVKEGSKDGPSYVPTGWR